MPTRPFTAVTVAAALALAAPAHAQPTPAPAAASAQLVAEATAHYEDGRLVEALAAFRRAHEIEPDAKLLYAMAKIEVELGQCAAAIEHLRQFMESRPGTKAVRAAEQEGKACNTVLTAPSVSTAPAASPADTAAPAPVPVPVSVIPADVLPSNDGPLQVRVEHRPWYTDAVGDVLTGAGVIGVATGATFLVLARSDSQADASTAAEHASLEDRARQRSLIGGVSLGVGTALVVGGIVRYATRDSERRLDVAAAPHPDGGWSVALAGRF